MIYYTILEYSLVPQMYFHLQNIEKFTLITDYNTFFVVKVFGTSVFDYLLLIDFIVKTFRAEHLNYFL